MPTSDLRRPYKRPQLSDQQRRRELLLKRQEQSRDAELHARRLASTLLSLPPEQQPSESEPEPAPGSSSDYDLRDSSKLKGPEARKWFAKQLMLPEWMIDVPHRLPHDWYVLPRPSGKRCFVVSSDGTTISRHRNGTILHRCPSALPSRNRDGSGPPSYSILDCIFHEGLLVYGIQGLEICRRNLDPNVCREACLYSLENKVPVIAFSKDRCLSLFDHPHVDSMHTVYHEPKAEIVPSVERLLAAADIQKLVFMDTAEGVSTALRPYWTEATGDRAIVVQIVPDMLELVPPGTSKGSGVKMLPDHLAITPKEIMAIGDGETDVEMLELAGLGICLSNGSEKTKAVANVIGSSNDEDGAADAIYRYAF